MVIDKHAVRERRIIDLTSHKVASFAQLPALGARNVVAAVRPRPPLVRSR
jgi:hypothetical protein